VKVPKNLCLAHLCNDLNNHYRTGVLRGVLHAVNELGISAAVFGVGTLDDRVLNSRMRNRLLSLVSPNDFDGIIHTTSSVSSFARIEHHQNATRHFGDIPAVHIGFCVTDHVITAHGRQKIAFIYGGKGGQESDARFAGYRRALGENGIDYDERYI
jgi:DNA-binding LacI/PurR family transcriptional regulator